MSKWTGLDPAGTEQLWKAALLKGVLIVFKEHEPFSRNDGKSPILDDLKQVYPNISWLQKDGRPIFRKNNPWEKLGLITSGTKNVHVTTVGDEVLSGEKDFTEVFIEATRDHREEDGSASYGIMCAAMLEMPKHVFTREDIEFGVSTGYQPGKTNLRDCITRSRRQGRTLPAKSRRVRGLRSLMKGLELTGAVAAVSGGWILDNRIAAQEIASANVRRPLEKVDRGHPIPTGRRAGRFSLGELREIRQGRPMRTITPSLIPPNPEQRAQLLEKANSIHEKLVSMIADFIRQAGGTPFDHPQSIDAAAKSPMPVILEVKTIHSANALDQIRNAVAKLWEYRWRWREEFHQDTTLVIVTDENPGQFLDPDLIEYLTVDRGLRLFWLDGDQLVDYRGSRLQDLLVHSA